MHFEGSNLVVAGHKIHVVLLGAIATILAAWMVVRARNQGSNVATVGPGATDLAIGALQSQLSALQGSVAQLSTPAPVGSVASTPPPTAPAPAPAPAPPAPAPAPAPPSPPPPAPAGQFVTVTPWPSQFGSLWGIAQGSGVSLGQVESLNPWILQQRGTWNLIYPGEQVRVR